MRNTTASKYRGWMTSGLLSRATLLFSVVMTIPTVAQQPGDLDPTFGIGGKVTTDIANDANSVAIQMDGKIVVAGYSTYTESDCGYDEEGNPYYCHSAFALTRYNSNGSLDTTFDGDGKVITHVATGYGYATSVAIQSDGKIVAAGAICGYDENGNPVYCLDGALALVRYNIDGSLDTTFDGDGKVTTDIGPYPDVAQSVAIQPDGKIVTAGTSSGSTYSNIALVRYNADGSLDTSFDGDGKVTTLIGTSAEANSVAIQSDGKIVAAGTSITQSNNYFAVVRYNPNGTLDTTFDGDGMVTTAIGTRDDVALSVAIQADQKIVVAGVSYYDICGYDENGNPIYCLDGAFALVRYNIDGSLDTTFDGDGKIVTSVGTSNYYDHDIANSVAIQPDGKIVVAGSDNGSGAGDYALVRYNTDGSLDTTFGGDGISTVDFNSGSNDRASEMALDGQGRAVLVGSSDGAFALARFVLGGTTSAPSECAYSFSANNSSFSVKGGAGGFDVTTDPECSWTANSNVGWIIVNSGAGTGNGSVTFTVLANSTKGARSGTINVGSQIFTVNQDAPGSRKRGR